MSDYCYGCDRVVADVVYVRCPARWKGVDGWCWGASCVRHAVEDATVSGWAISVVKPAETFRFDLVAVEAPLGWASIEGGVCS